MAPACLCQRDGQFDRARKVRRRAGVQIVIARGVERFLYLYEFGDHWLHDVIVEGSATAQRARSFPPSSMAPGAARPRMWAECTASWSSWRRRSIRFTRSTRGCRSRSSLLSANWRSRSSRRVHHGRFI